MQGHWYGDYKVEIKSKAHCIYNILKSASSAEERFWVHFILFQTYLKGVAEINELALLYTRALCTVTSRKYITSII